MKDWYYFILDEQGRSFRVVDDVVSLTNQATPLSYAPDGWQDIAVGWERDMKRMGPVRMFTFPPKFVKDGATIIRHILYTHGPEFKAYLLVTNRKIEVTPTIFKDYHTKFYRGQINLTSVEDKEDYVSCKIDELGIAKLIKLHENTKFDIPLKDSEASNVHMDGMVLRQINHFLINAIGGMGRHYVDAALTTTDGRAAGFAGYSVFTQVASDPINYATDLSYLWSTHQDTVEMNMKGEIKFLCPQTNSVRIWIESNQGYLHELFPNQAITPNQEYVVPFDINITGHADEKFWLLARSAVALSPIQYRESRFDIAVKSIADSSIVRAYKPHILLDKILEKICGERGKSVAPVLETGEARAFFLTSGDGMRGLEDATVKLSFNEFFDIYRILGFAGAGVEDDKLKMEVLDYFLNPNDPIHLGEVADLVVKPAEDLMCNTIKVGYKEKSIEEANGKYVFNITHIYTTPVESLVKEMQLIAPCIADPFVIEDTRISFEERDTTDSTRDNDLMLLHVDPDPSIDPTVAHTDTIQGMTDDGFIQYPTITGLNLTHGIFTDELVYTGLFAATLDLTINTILDGFGSTVLVELLVNGAVVASMTNQADNLTYPLQHQFTINPNDRIRVRCTRTTLGNFSVVFSQMLFNLNDELYTLYRVPYDEIKGVPDDPTIFNIELITPKRILLKWLRWLNAIHYKQAGQLIKFASTERNAELYTRRNTTIIEEKAPLELTATSLFFPFFIEIDTVAPVDLIDLLTANPHRPFDFEWKGNTFIGHLVKAGIAADSNKSQVYKLLCTNNTDLTKLIE